jgi:uncharacterized protein with HEPN domain
MNTGKLADDIRILHIKDAINQIFLYTKNIDPLDFLADEMRFDAVIRQLEIIGEASNHISENYRLAHPKINWRQLIGLRNLLIHAYFGIDKQMISQIVFLNLPELQQKISEL